jgi:hypothetical protein
MRFEPLRKLQSRCAAWMLSGWSSRRAEPMPLGSMWSGTISLQPGEGLVTYPAVPFLSGDLLGEEFPQFRGRTQFPVSSGMIRVVDALDTSRRPRCL